MRLSLKNFQLTKPKRIFLISALMLVSASSLTAAAFEVKNASISRFLAGIGTKDKNQAPSLNNAKVSSQEAQTRDISETSSGSAESSSNSAVVSRSSGSKKSGSSNNSNTSNSSGDSSSQNSNPGNASTSTPSPSPASSNIFGYFSNSSVESIVNALDLVKDDGLGDWTEPGGGGPPGGVYHYNPIDLDNIYMGVHNGRFYLKWTLGGTIPSVRETIGSDIIKTLTYNVKISTEEHPEASNNCGGTAAFLQINIAYHDSGQIWYNPWFNSICTNSGPYPNDHAWTFQNAGNGLAHTYNSGLGKTSIVYSYSMADLGNNFIVGQTVKVDFYSEAESNNYEHYSFEGNSPAWPEWVVKQI